MKQLLIALLALLPLAVQANDWQEGRHYERLSSSVGTEVDEGIEVAEVFWYGCPACYRMQPLLGPWEEALDDDVTLTHVPAALRSDWQPHARAFYVAKSLDVLDRVHSDLFDALAGERQRLDNEDRLAAFFAERGVDEEEFREAWNSFSVNSMMRRGDSRVRGAGVSGTPTLIVNGRYMITVRGAGSHENMLEIADYLVDRERESD